MIPQNNPMKNPPNTSFKVCWRTMMRAEPNRPESKINPQRQGIGLNRKRKLYESKPPIIIPLLAAWVLIFHQILKMVHNIIQISTASRIPAI